MVAVLPIAIRALGTVPKGVDSGLEALKLGGKIDTIQTIRILRKFLETWGDFVSLWLQWETISERLFENNICNTDEMHRRIQTYIIKGKDLSPNGHRRQYTVYKNWEWFGNPNTGSENKS